MEYKDGSVVSGYTENDILVEGVVKTNEQGKKVILTEDFNWTYLSEMKIVKLVEEDGVYRLVIKDPSGLSSFAYEAAEGIIVEVKLVASASAEAASIDVTSLSPVLLAHIEVGEGKSSGAGIPVWIWIVVGALVLVVGVLVALFLISRKGGNSSSSE